MNNALQVPRIQLFGRTACSLCDEARDIVVEACAKFDVTYEEIDVDTDPELRAEYGELVPVVLVDGEQIGFWRIDEKRLHAALSG